MSNLEKKLFTASIVIYGFLVIFSYSYVDLNLTLSSQPVVVNTVAFLQKLGYYNRPIATFTYILFLIASFFLFSVNLFLFYRSKISAAYLKFSTVVSTTILVFAYPFLSSDIFNYMFDAKIILKYHLNPYTHKALDFPNDEWIRFMRWIHRYSPYGPLWLGLSLIPSFLGLGKFILSLFAFKVFIGAFHIVNSYLIYKFLNGTKNQLFYTAFYSLNPLLLIEGVVNAHNDVVLATFIIATTYLLKKRKNFAGYLSLVFGVIVKYLTVLSLPWIVWATFTKDKNYIKKFIFLNLGTMVVFTFLFSTVKISVPFVSAASTQVQFQPWYLFWTLPIIALAVNINLIIIAGAVSAAALLRYLPYLFYGDWTHPQTVLFMKMVVIIPLFAASAILISKKFVKR